MLDHLQQPGIAAEKVLPEVSAAFDEIFLVLSVAHFTQALYQNSVAIVLDELIPVGAPDDFNDVPSGTTEDGFKFLNDLSIAANRAIETLQVAVDHEDEVVEFFARGKRDGAERFGLIHFAIAEERPDFAARGLLETAIFQILDKTRVINRLDGAGAHGDSRELPELGHEPGMGIGRQAATGLQLAAEVLQFFLGNAAFEVRTRINSGCGVTLEINDVAIAVFSLRTKEVIECHFV